MPLTKYWVKDALGEDKNKGVVEEWSRDEPTWFLGTLFFYKNHVYKNVEAQISKKLRTC